MIKNWCLSALWFLFRFLCLTELCENACKDTINLPYINNYPPHFCSPLPLRMPLKVAQFFNILSLAAINIQVNLIFLVLLFEIWDKYPIYFRSLSNLRKISAKKPASLFFCFRRYIWGESRLSYANREPAAPTFTARSPSNTRKISAKKPASLFFCFRFFLYL